MQVITNEPAWIATATCASGHVTTMKVPHGATVGQRFMCKCVACDEILEGNVPEKLQTTIEIKS